MGNFTMDTTLDRLKNYVPGLSKAESHANKLSQTFSAPPIPVLEIAEENGVNVIFAKFKEYSEKVSGFCDFKAARLYVNADDDTERQSFTIAHELGHWILHRELYEKHPDQYHVLPRYNKPDQDDPLEKEADEFAASLLVPKHLLNPVIGSPLSVLANIFGVQSTVMASRVKNIT